MRGPSKASSAGSSAAARIGRGFATLCVACLAAGLFLALTPASVLAGKGTVSVFSASSPNGIAINEATGHVYVMELGKVGVYDADGNPLFAFGDGFGGGPGQFANNAGIAINQITGDVYTLDMQFNYRIQQFSSSGSFIRMWGYDVNATTPATGFEICAAASGDICQAGQGSSQPGGFSADGISKGMYLAIDPVTGNVIAADGGNKRAQVFTANGSFVRVLGSASVFPGNNSPFTVTADSLGNVFAAGYEGTIEKFNPAGELSPSFGGGIATIQMAIDPGNDHLFLVRRDATSGEWEIAEYDPSGALVDKHAVGIPEPTGIAVNSASGRIYVTSSEDGQVIVIDAVGTPPVATVGPATDITPTSATLNATVDPEGSSFDTHWRFDCTPACPGLSGGNAGNGTADVAVSEVATGLDPNTTYQVRLIATREFGAGQTISGAGSFTTAAVGPVVSLVAASRVTDTAARLGAAIDAKHSATTYRFEYGTGTGYGSFVPAGGPGDAGQALGPKPAFERITGLAPATTYHFKVVVENSAGTVESTDVSFTTRSSAEAALPPRGIELASPSDKGNQNPAGYLSNDGNGVIWSTFGGVPGSSLGKYAQFEAERGSTGWASRSLVPQPSDLVGGGDMGYVLVAASDDFSSVLFHAGEKGNSSTETEPFTYVRYTPATGQQEVLDTFPEGAAVLGDSDSKELASVDGKHLFVWVREAPEEGQPRQVYDIGDGTRRLVTVMPDTGEKPTCGAVLLQRYRTLSADGSRFYFMSSGDDCSAPRQIYLRDDQRTPSMQDDTTTRVSAPALAGPEGSATVVRANPAGDSIVYYSDAQITADDTDLTTDLYRWRIAGGNECLTCMVQDIGAVLDSYEQPGNVVVSEDLSHLYISTGGGLVSGEGEDDAHSLYLIVDDELKYIAPGALFRNNAIEQEASMTPNGSVFVFRGYEPGITADATGGFSQYYLYSERSDSVECLSCAPPGVQQAEPATRTIPGPAFGEALAASESRMLSGDGSTFAFETDAALVSGDANAGPDIYEWHNGTIRLVTDGEGEYGAGSVPLSLNGMSPDGANILFRVAAKLTGFERDDVGQLFVARRGGGFPPPSPEAGCAEDGCQGPLEGAPIFARPGSAAIVGPGSSAEPQRRGRPRCRKAVKPAHARKGRARCPKANSKRKGKTPRHRAEATDRSGK